ncbi:hypothetical protein BKA66DRAFT_150462 [Pyrenochaeta sp. MPI-SDFR-AT-0127]|nr:hypothetical protein BKA66DRAFT_150462 [Pyrenochaeta sp. MPI-SDFR-AT-0127]
MMHRLSQAASVLALASTGLAQLPAITPFTVTGSLDNCKVVGTEYNAGGEIEVNNFVIEVPKNLIVQFPVVWAPFKDLCDAEASGYETTVVGNVVNGKVIAGQVSVAQRFGLEGSQGYIEAINPDGTLKVAAGPTVRINDPDGLFGPKFETKKFWIADTANPSVSSFSGFPMCIPYSGNTDKCKSTNRPNGQSFTPPDPLAMVPFKVGDFIEYSGLRVGTGEILASSIVCPSLQITTRAGDPNYIRVEDMLVGVPDNAPNVEFADIKVIGFLSNCAGASVVISAIEVDPCTGKETYRPIGTTNPKQEARCKWEARIASPAQAPFTREYRITTNSPVKDTNDGIKAGQFIAAVGEWIFPEVDVPGTNPPPYLFTDIRGLVQGDFLDGKQYGPLSPFPGANPPAPAKVCKPEDIPDPNAPPTTPTNPDGSQIAPVASIEGITATQRVGVDVALSGSNTAQGLIDNDLNFVWTKTSPASASVSITNANSAKASFNAPKVTTETSFVFELTVSLKSNATNLSKSTVTVKVNPTIADKVTIDTYTWESKQSGTITASCSSNVKNGDNKGMTLLINGGTRIAMTNGGAGKWLYSSRSTARPNNLKCISDLKGESAQRLGTATTRRKRAFIW